MPAAGAPRSRLDSPSPVRRHLATAAGYWEPRRVGYNAVLCAVAGTWIIATWPHFRLALQLTYLAPLLVLALFANVCYCAAYLVELPMQISPFATRGQRSRWGLWLAGTLFAVFLEWYWIGDEIYPDFQ